MRDRIPKTTNPAYHLKMTNNPELQEISFFEQLKGYTEQLQTTAGRRAYSKFKLLKEGDMQKTT
jgi:hypothetical protein